MPQCFNLCMYEKPELGSWETWGPLGSFLLGDISINSKNFFYVYQSPSALAYTQPIIEGFFFHFPGLKTAGPRGVSTLWHLQHTEGSCQSIIVSISE